MLTTQRKNRWTTKRCLISASKASKACAERYSAGGPGLLHTFAGTRLVGQTRIHQRPATVAKQLSACCCFHKVLPGCLLGRPGVPKTPPFFPFLGGYLGQTHLLYQSLWQRSKLSDINRGSSQRWGDILWLLIKGHIEGLPIVSDALPLL